MLLVLKMVKLFQLLVENGKLFQLLVKEIVNCSNGKMAVLFLPGKCLFRFSFLIGHISDVNSIFGNVVRRRVLFMHIT